MEDRSVFTESQPKEISNGLQNFIDSMVEEIVLEGKPFDTQKKYLKKYSENEGINYDELENDLTAFIELLDNLKSSFSTVLVRVAQEKAKACYISEPIITKLVSFSAGNKEVAQSGTRPTLMIESGKKIHAFLPKLQNSEHHHPVSRPKIQ